VALKRVCDITGTDRDVEICDVTIAGQTIKLDLAPAGVDKLREFFGSVVTVRHPLADSSSNEPTSAADSSAATSAASGNGNSAEDETAETGAASAAENGGRSTASAAAEPAARESAASERSARRGRRPASVKGARKKAVARRAAKPVAQAQATAEIREWARANGFEVGERGAIPGRIRSAYTLAHE
jgi:Lsr2